MSKVVAKLVLKGTSGYLSTLLVTVQENQMVSYSLFGSVSRISFALSNLQIKEPLPDLLLDYDDVSEMIRVAKDAIRTGVESIVATKIYS